MNYQHVIDATTGKVLYRHDTTNFDAGDAKVFRDYPGAPVGGTQKVVNFYKPGFLPKGQKTWLRGTYAISWADVNDNNVADLSEKTPVPSGGYAFHQFNVLPSLCSNDYRCTWRPSKAFSWQRNLKLDVDQASFYDSSYHNYLMKAPFGFTPRPATSSCRAATPS